MTDQSKRNNQAIGRAIRELRQQKHILQAELAKRLGMLPAQLCNIERGKNSPSLRTMQRIADALEVTVNDLILTSATVKEEIEIPQDIEEQPSEIHNLIYRHGFARISREGSLPTLSLEVAIKLDGLMKDYLSVEEKCGVNQSMLLPLHIPFEKSDMGADMLARMVRRFCGIGNAIIFDVVELFEFLGIRVLFTDLPGDLESLSFYDRVKENLFIFLKEGISLERQQFRMAYEIANAYLYSSNKDLPVSDTRENRRFAKHFAESFLMPEETMRVTFLQLCIPKNAWTMDLLLRIKQRYGVSAESFIDRLEELGAIDKDTRQTFKDQLQTYYSEHNGQEPMPEQRILSRHSRLEYLKLCAELNVPDTELSGE